MPPLWKRFLRRSEMDRELDSELQSYRDLLADRFAAEGLSREEARRRAALETKGVADNVREAWAGAALDTLAQDVRYAARSLGRNKTFALAAILTLALGIGANTAVFSVLHAVLLEPLPYSNSDRLALVWSDFSQTGAKRAPTSGVALVEIRRRARALADLAGIWVGGGTFVDDGLAPEQAKVAQVTPNFFSVLGVNAALGRTFTEEEGAGRRAAIVLSHGLWQRRFGGDPSLVGRQVRLDGGSFEVVGILPEGFRLYFPEDANVAADIPAYVPFPYPVEKGPLTLYFIRLLGRVRPDVTLADAQRDLDRVAAELRQAYPAYAQEKLALQLVPLHGDAVRGVRPAILALFGGSAVLVLICCVNVANLLLARASARRKEIAVRASLGASPARVMRQLFLESAVLAALAGALGLAIGWWGVRLLLQIRPEQLARLRDVELNLPLLAFVAGVATLASLVCGLAPAWQATRISLTEALHAGGRTGAAQARPLLRRTLVVAEVTLSFLLVAASGLLGRTMLHLAGLWPGFDPAQTITFAIDLPGARYRGDAARDNFVRLWEERLRALPGVVSAGAVSHLPLDDYPNWYSPYRPEGVAPGAAGGLLADHRTVTFDYLAAMRARLIAGRFFDDRDRAGSHPVVIVDRLLAESAWPGRNPAGQRLEIEQFHNGAFAPVTAEVVGVVEHLQHHSLTARPRGQIYIPYPQSPRPHLTFVARTSGDPLALARDLQRALAALDPQLAVSKVRTLASYVERAAAPAGFTALLAGIFAALALLLAAIGVYGVIAGSVAQRERELGVRLALGARGADLARLVAGEGLLLTAAGLAFGLAASLGVSRWLRSLVAGVAPWDPVTYLLAAAVVLLVALAACLRPAWRAAHADPLSAIRSE